MSCEGRSWDSATCAPRRATCGGDGELSAGARRRTPGDTITTALRRKAHALDKAEPNDDATDDRMLAIAGGPEWTGRGRVSSARPRPAAAPVVPADRRSPSAQYGICSTTVNFRRAQTILQRVSFELYAWDAGAGGAAVLPRRVLVSDGRLTCRRRASSGKSPTFRLRRTRRWTLLRAGDANLRLWRRPSRPSYGETARRSTRSWRAVFPTAMPAGRARIHVGRLQNQFCRETTKTGIFYLRRKRSTRDHLFQGLDRNYPTAHGRPTRYCGCG